MFCLLYLPRFLPPKGDFCWFFADFHEGFSAICPICSFATRRVVSVSQLIFVYGKVLYDNYITCCFLHFLMWLLIFLFLLEGFEGIRKLFFHLISFGGVLCWMWCFSQAGKTHRDIGFTFTKCDLTVNELYFSVTIDNGRVFFCFGINRLLFLSFFSRSWEWFLFFVICYRGKLYILFYLFVPISDASFYYPHVCFDFSLWFCFILVEIERPCKDKEACLLAVHNSFCSETLFLFCKLYYTMRKLIIVLFLNVSCIIPFILTLRKSWLCYFSYEYFKGF